MDGRTITLLAIVVAGALIVAPFVLWPNYGETAYTLDVEPANPTKNGSVVAYEDLNATEKKTFDEARQEGSDEFFSEDVDVRSFHRNSYVNHEGSLYYVSLSHGDGAWIYVTVLRWAMFGGGAILAIAGGIQLARTAHSTNHDPRPD